MKCLFFLYGEYRTFPTAVKTWNILDIPDLDIVIHTPNTTSDYLGSNKFKPISKKKFNILNNPKVFLYNREDFRNTDDHVLHFSWRFLSKYLKETNIKYHYIFVGRLDSSFYVEDWKELISTQQNFLFPLQLATGNTFIRDHAFFGSGTVVKNFVDNLPNRNFWSADPHLAMCKYIEENFNEKMWKKFESNHIRPNWIRYFDLYFKNKKIKNIDTDYADFIDYFIKNCQYNLDIEYKKNYRKDWIREYKFKKNELEDMFKSFKDKYNLQL